MVLQDHVKEDKDTARKKMEKTEGIERGGVGDRRESVCTDWQNKLEGATDSTQTLHPLPAPKLGSILRQEPLLLVGAS